MCGIRLAAQKELKEKFGKKVELELYVRVELPSFREGKPAFFPTRPAFPNGCAAFQKEPPKDPEQKGPSFRSIFLLCRPSKCFISFFSFYANHLSYFFFARLKNEI